MPAFTHPQFTRRTAIQAGAVGLLELGVGDGVGVEPPP